VSVASGDGNIEGQQLNSLQKECNAWERMPIAANASRDSAGAIIKLFGNKHHSVELYVYRR
jgi:hypothetical protein